MQQKPFLNWQMPAQLKVKILDLGINRIFYEVIRLFHSTVHARELKVPEKN